MRLFIKDFLSVGISKFIIIIFGLGKGIITARWLGPEGNGIIAALTVYPSLFITFGSLGISQSVTHFVGKGKFSEQQLKTSIVQLWIFTSVISVLSVYLIVRHLSVSQYDLYWIMLAAMPIPFTLFNKYNSGLFLGKNEIKTYNRINWLPTAIVFISLIFLVVIFQFEISGALLAFSLGPLIMSVILIVKFKFLSSFSIKVNWNILKSLLSLGIIYALALLLINLNYKIDIILLDSLSNAYELGIYSKGVAFTDYLWQIPMFISTIVFARSANAKNGNLFSKKVALLLRISIVVIGLGSLVLLFLSKYIIIGLYGVDFKGSIKVLQFLLPGVLLLTIFKVLNMDLAGKGKPWISMQAMLPALVINIIMNVLMIPKFGALGAALSSTVSYSIAALIFLFLYSRQVEIPIKKILGYSMDDVFYFKNSLKSLKIAK